MFSFAWEDRFSVCVNEICYDLSENSPMLMTATRPHGQRQLAGGMVGEGGALIDIFRMLPTVRDAFFAPHFKLLFAYTEMSKILCTWLREVCSCCSLTVLPGPAWVLLNYVLQRIFLSSVHYGPNLLVARSFGRSTLST